MTLFSSRNSFRNVLQKRQLNSMQVLRGGWIPVFPFSEVGLLMLLPNFRDFRLVKKGDTAMAMLCLREFGFRTRRVGHAGAGEGK